MVGGHVYPGGFIWITVDAQGDFITSLQVEHPTSVQATIVINTYYWRLHHGNGFAVYINKNPPIVVVVNLSVDVIPSGGRHCQFSVVVLHTACKMAVRSTDRPILDHYETNYQHISVKL